MKESNASEKMQRLAMQPQNCLPECKLMKMKKDAEEMKTSSQLNRVKVVNNNYFPSSLPEPDQCQTLEVYKKLSLQKWNN